MLIVNGRIHFRIKIKKSRQNIHAASTSCQGCVEMLFRLRRQVVQAEAIKNTFLFFSAKQLLTPLLKEKAPSHRGFFIL